MSSPNTPAHSGQASGVGGTSGGEPTSKAVDALMLMRQPSGVGIEIKLWARRNKEQGTGNEGT